MDITVISSGKDGAELRMEKTKNAHFIVCDGKYDDADINEASCHVSKGQRWTLPDGAWENIFRGKK